MINVKHRALTTNYLLNISGSVLPLVAAFITVPVYISTIGAARYGILAAVWILLGYFGFLDFGLSRASAIALSRLGRAGPAERSPVLVTALYTNAFFGAIGGLLLFFASGLLLPHFMHLTSELAKELRTAMPWVACMLPVALISGVGSGALDSRERFLVSNLYQTFGGVLGQVGPLLCALLIGPSLSVVLPAALLTRVISTIMIWSSVLSSEHPVDFRRFERGKVRELLGYGAWLTVSSSIAPLLQTFDQLMIGALLGPAAIAHYSVPMNLATRSQVISIALSKTLFPRMSQASPANARIMATRAVVAVSFALGAVCGPAILLAGPFLRAWVGADFAGYATPVAQILLVGAWANGLAYLPYGMLQGQGRPDLIAKIHSVEVLPFLLVLYLLLRAFGLPGAALAWTLRTVIDCLIMLSVARCWLPPLKPAAVSLGLMGGSFALAELTSPTLLPRVALAVVAGGAFAAAALAFEPKARTAARAALAVVGQARARLVGRQPASL